MNLGQKIYLKSKNNETIENEVAELKKIIDQIEQNEKHLPDINLNMGLTQKFTENIKKYVKSVDNLLYTIHQKYFIPNGFDLTSNIFVRSSGLNCEILVDSSDLSTKDIQLNLEFMDNEINNIKEYDYCDELNHIWDNHLFQDLLTALNISELALILGVIWFNDEIDFEVLDMDINYEN